MTSTFIRIGEHVLAVAHITEANRTPAGDVEIFTCNDQATHLHGEEAGLFWTWITSALHTTTIALPTLSDMAARA